MTSRSTGRLEDSESYQVVNWSEVRAEQSYLTTDPIDNMGYILFKIRVEISDMRW